MWAMGLVPRVWREDAAFTHQQQETLQNCWNKHLHICLRLSLVTLQMNSMSSLSMSFTTMIFILLRKCRARSLRASLQWRSGVSVGAQASVCVASAPLRT